MTAPSDDDPLATARGCCLALVLGAGIWAAALGLAWAVLRAIGQRGLGL